MAACFCLAKVRLYSRAKVGRFVYFTSSLWKWVNYFFESFCHTFNGTALKETSNDRKIRYAHNFIIAKQKLKTEFSVYV
jgi:hypothetical protein